MARNDINRYSLEELYVEKQLSAYRISKILKCNYITVIRKLKKFGIPIRITMVQHHTKYAEIHGTDELKDLSLGEHIKLHRRLRREGKCKITVDKLRKISGIANKRTEKHKETMRRINKKRNKTEKIKQMKSDYSKKAERRIEFNETVSTNVLLFETIIYNALNGNVYITTHASGNHGLKLYEINERQPCQEQKQFR